MLIIEAVAVGLISISISLFIKNVFVIGFIKHFMSGLLGLHTWYCEYKFGKKCKVNIYKLILESLLEGIMFVVMYNYINVQYSFFWIGFILHIVADVLGIHKIFCNTLI